MVGKAATVTAKRNQKRKNHTKGMSRLSLCCCCVCGTTTGNSNGNIFQENYFSCFLCFQLRASYLIFDSSSLNDIVILCMSVFPCISYDFRSFSAFKNTVQVRLLFIIISRYFTASIFPTILL